MSDLATADDTARATALDVSRSFIVQAPAGSGKTTVLTQRYLALLASVDEPEEVLAITFTRKAAGEMRERVLKALAGNIQPRSPADRLTLELAGRARQRAEARSWGLEESAARLRIQTIDSFHGSLARALPITSRGKFGLRVADDTSDLYKLAARATMREAERDLRLRADFDLVQRGLDNQWHLLEALIASMLPRRAEWLPNLEDVSGEAIVPRVEESLRMIVSEELVLAAAGIRRSVIEAGAAFARAISHAEKLPEGLEDLRAWQDAPAEFRARVTDLVRWRALAAIAINREGGVRKTFNKTHGVPADDADRIALRDRWVGELASLVASEIAAFSAIARLPDPRMTERAAATLEALGRLLLHAVVKLKEVFAVQGECDHTEVAAYARQALYTDSSPTPLAERLDARLKHILVDEFQDTSREQYELLHVLTLDWTSGDGRTLFLVGDPMQSIYAFRNAEVGRFATVRDAGLGNVTLEPLYLRRNFRSAPVLVEWCNDVFATVFPEADDPRTSAVRHLASVAARKDLESPSPHLYRFEGPDAGSVEGTTIAGIVANLRATNPGESIAVLASTRGQLRAARNALAARGIPFVGIKLEPLADLSVVRDLEALTRALDAPLDRIAWLAVLRSPMVGLTLPDLTVVAAAGSASILEALIADRTDPNPQLSADGRMRLERVAPILIAAWEERDREPWAHRVERVWMALGGPSCVRSKELVHARNYFSALDQAASARQRGRTIDLERVMSELYATEESVEPAPVSLMTIHGAKGLEFDHVLVAGIGRRGRPDTARLLNWLELPRAGKRDDLLMAPVRLRGESDDDDDAINKYMSWLHRERARTERARQAYVALTRARRGLHVLVHPKMRKDGPDAEKSTLLENLWPALSTAVCALEAVSADDPAPRTLVLSQLRTRLRSDARPAATPPDVLAHGEVVPLADEEGIEFSWARQTARRVGTVVHEALERFGRSGLPRIEDLPRLRARLESRLQTLGVESPAAVAGAERALSALEATLEDTRGRWLFDASHSEAHSELALTGVRGAAIVNAVIDRTFVADGIRWVVDFKTSPHEGGDREAFLDSEVERYTAQLTRYVHLAGQLGPQPVRAGLYFPLLGAWREVEIAQ
jgi:ATP-dependent exoDNAse (exonuclease V) beta subunit